MLDTSQEKNCETEQLKENVSRQGKRTPRSVFDNRFSAQSIATRGLPRSFLVYELRHSVSVEAEQEERDIVVDTVPRGAIEIAGGEKP